MISDILKVGSERVDGNGEALTEAEQVEQLLDSQQVDSDQCKECLTQREMETLLLVARGMVAKEIARTLAISEKTVRNHIGSIYRKLDIHDRLQVMIYAMKKGLVDINDV